MSFVFFVGLTFVHAKAVVGKTSGSLALLKAVTPTVESLFSVLAHTAVNYASCT